MRSSNGFDPLSWWKLLSLKVTRKGLKSCFFLHGHSVLKKNGTYWLAVCESASRLCYKSAMIGVSSLPYLLMPAVGSQDPVSQCCSNELY